MHKLFKADIFLVFLTLIGLTYLFYSNLITSSCLLVVFLVYLSSKIIGYIILPYDKFNLFIDHLSTESHYYRFSGFEIFKGILVLLLYLGFVFIDPRIWIIESILVIFMRIWGLHYINNQNRVNSYH